ncbi:MAG: Flp pilus assembly complex ATPase component TadA [Armatimonadetes bacterium]|nr:Flp pilus assembly complex ATPase component TadA [Armatimonadota bacterium]MBS1712271.1 Flp pilus assembly complex ATPase component TadA [Armatimonadota bacterium]MBX3107978.1 Flp pilus assembly complex ATPase component TadA [Fimbriimonadaceae bacterium]
MAIERLPMTKYLIDKGYLKPDQLEEALKVQEQTKNPNLGKILTDLGMVGEREVTEAQAQEAGYPFVDLDNVSLESSAVNVVPDRIAKLHSVIPVRKDGTMLWVAMSNPNNLEAIDAVRFASGCMVKPAVAVPGAIEDAIRRYYGSGEAAPSAEANGAAVAAAKAEMAKKSGQTAGISALVAQAQVSRDADEARMPTGDDEDGAELAEQAPIIKLANAVIQTAIVDRASDIHVEPQERTVRIRYRIDGVLAEAMTVPKNLQAPLISRFKIMAEMNIAERRVPQDGRIEVRHQGQEFDLRVSSIPTPFGEKIVMRILDKGNAMIGLGKLGFTEENQAAIEELISQPNGMFLCTGPTGSGKTTTQYSVLHMLNSVERNIITVEDPVEYQLNGLSQVQVNKKAGLTFGTALRAFLRQDPDIIMVGEMRDLETAEIAIEASLTGHLVLSTLHTNDAPSATLRMIDMGVEPYLISATVVGVLAQRLGRRIDNSHKEPYEVREIELRRFGFQVQNPDAKVTLYRGIPHEDNRMTGFKGRTGFHELMVMNGEIAEMVVRRAPLNDIKAAAKANGMKELREDGLGKVLMGQTTPDEVMRVVFTAGF